MEDVLVYCRDQNNKLQTYKVEDSTISEALKAVKYEMEDDYKHPALALILGGKHKKQEEKEAA